MELPVRVIIFCPTIEFKNKQGRLIAISEQYYEAGGGYESDGK